MTIAIELFKRMEAEWKASGRITWPAYEIEVRTLLKYSDHGGFEHTLQKLISDVADIQNAMYRLGFMAAPPAIAFPSVSHQCQRTAEQVAIKNDQVVAGNLQAFDDAINASYFKDLLARYIKHVRGCEGVDFIETGSAFSDEKFSEREWNILKELAK